MNIMLTGTEGYIGARFGSWLTRAYLHVGAISYRSRSALSTVRFYSGLIAQSGSPHRAVISSNQSLVKFGIALYRDDGQLR